ncbi:hypothetical protein BGZ57DRAFT_930853 [Hyaloscypha finlandica]|nr:hypothetical protein BGZ57DRAFT_930853 [Hyaloscypha finlandica]
MPRRNNQCYIHLNSEIVNTARVVSAYIIVVAMFAAIGSFLFGFAMGIATATIAHQSWIDYMGHPPTASVGAVVAVYIAGKGLRR